MLVRVASCANATTWHRASIPNTSVDAIGFLKDNAIYLHECHNPDNPEFKLETRFYSSVLEFNLGKV
jgi:hypothetical protein